MTRYFYLICSPSLRGVHMKIELNWPSGFKDKVFRNVDTRQMGKWTDNGGTGILIAHLCPRLCRCTCETSAQVS